MLSSQLEGRIVDAMKQLGFNASDARVYIALLKIHPATGYELATKSGVPRSAIYNVLHRLEGMGLINSVQKKPAKFIPLSPERLFQLLESRFKQNLEALRGELENFARPAEEAVMWTIRGYPAMLEQAQTLIREAEESVYASLWRREAMALEKPLIEARERGVRVSLFSFNALPTDLGRVCCYGIEEGELEAHWSHKIILIADHTRLLVGGADKTEDNRSVVTEEPTLVEMATNNLILDITLLGQRNHEEVSDVVRGLTERMAPVDHLLKRRIKAQSA